MENDITNIKTNLALTQAVDELLSLLKKDRERDILIRRHGIKNKPAQTLEQIGGELGITRERVRQIEKSALTRIKEQSNLKNNMNRMLVDIIKQTGGVVQMGQLIEALSLDPAQVAELYFLVRLAPNISLVEKTGLYDNIVLLDKLVKPAKLHSTHQTAVDTIKANKKPLKLDKLVALITPSLDDSSLYQLLEASHKIVRLNNHYGLSTWPQVNPKSIRDKIYFVLHRASRPMHFSDIASQIQNLKTNPKKVTTQAVHNELIKDKRFVLIGRGIYALDEWGYQAGTVADIIEGILKEESPLSKDEIVRRVLARRQVKATTIALNLQEKPQFERVGKGTYRLAQS